MWGRARWLLVRGCCSALQVLTSSSQAKLSSVLAIRGAAGSQKLLALSDMSPLFCTLFAAQPPLLPTGSLRG